MVISAQGDIEISPNEGEKGFWKMNWKTAITNQSTTNPNSVSASYSFSSSQKEPLLGDKTGYGGFSNENSVRRI
jgi:hypothetical protein